MMPLTDSVLYSYSAYMLTSLELEQVINSDFIDSRTWYFERLQPSFNRLSGYIDALSQAMYDDLTITFNVKTSASATTYQTRTLELKKANGDAVEFAGRAKHRITGVALNASVWNFETITLKGDVIGWTIVDDDDIHYNSNDTPQATQFAVFGDDVKNVYDLHHNDAGKDYRQHWVIGSGSAAFTFSSFFFLPNPNILFSLCSCQILFYKTLFVQVLL